jgi:hypothetical protein
MLVGPLCGPTKRQKPKGKNYYELYKAIKSGTHQKILEDPRELESPREL